MASIIDKFLKGLKKKEEKSEAPQRVSEDAARKRREELARKQREASEAAARATKATEERLKALEEKKKEAKTVAAEAPKVVSLEHLPPGVQAQEKRTYVVKAGDSLSKIAKNLYGDAKRWPEIYEANKDLIGDNPNLIHPGQEYRIP